MSTKLAATFAALIIATVAVSSIAVVGGSPNFDYECDEDGNITATNTSSGMLRGALWNVEDYSGLEKFSQRGDQLTWNDPGDTVGPHVFKVTLKVYTYAGVERSITKDVVRDGYKEYTVSWTYNHNNYSIMVSIHTSDFIQYKDTKINRAPGGSVNSALVSEFVSGTSTSNDAFEYIVQQFNDQFAGKGLSQEDRINCVMLFVENIGYATDMDTTGQDEYWKFPIETLFAQGDCEDLAMLMISLLIAIEDLPMALFIFWNIHNSGSGHAMAAVDARTPHPSIDIEDTSSGWYTTPDGLTFYACETTAVGWAVGEMPPQLSDVRPDRILEVNV